MFILTAQGDWRSRWSFGTSSVGADVS